MKLTLEEIYTKEALHNILHCILELVAAEAMETILGDTVYSSNTSWRSAELRNFPCFECRPSLILYSPRRQFSSQVDR